MVHHGDPFNEQQPLVKQVNFTSINILLFFSKCLYTVWTKNVILNLVFLQEVDEGHTIINTVKLNKQNETN